MCVRMLCYNNTFEFELNPTEIPMASFGKMNGHDDVKEDFGSCFLHIEEWIAVIWILEKCGLCLLICRSMDQWV